VKNQLNSHQLEPNAQVQIDEERKKLKINSNREKKSLTK
jgi:hypothetical protein